MKILFCITFSLTLILSSFIAFSFSLQTYDLFHHWSSSPVGDMEFKTYSQNIIGFLSHQNTLSPDFSSKEALHMQDVRQLLDRIRIVDLIAIVITSAIILLNKDRGELIASMVKLGSYITIVISITLALAAVPFTAAFEKFHRIFFQGNWQFPAESLLIRLFPEEFFLMHFIAGILGILLTSAIFISMLRKKDLSPSSDVPNKRKL